MIPTFPDLRPDELLYSGIARYDAILRFTPIALREQFFGDGARPAAVIDLPGPLVPLSGRLPRPDLLPGQHLLEYHTTFPYYAPFLPADRRERAKQALLHRGPGGVHRMLGARSNGVRAPAFMRFCPVCAAEHVRLNGEPAAWLRTHQLPGVFLCPIHGVPLHTTEISCRSGHNTRFRFHALTRRIRDRSRPEIIHQTEQRILRSLAEGSAYLLGHPNLSAPDLRDRYQRILLDLGWWKKGPGADVGSVDFHARSYFPSRLLEELGCPFGRSQRTWVSEAISHRTSHPLRHLLVLSFLRVPLSVLFAPESAFSAALASVSGRPAPVEERCLFPDCPRFTDRARPAHASSRQVRHVCSECGCTWILCGRGWRLVRTSRRWEDRLRSGLSERRESPGELAARLGVGEAVMRHHAWRLGLLRPSPASPRRRPRLRPDLRVTATMLTADRQWLLKTRERHPGWSRVEIQNSAPTRYTRLAKHDRAYMEAHLPPRGSIAARLRRDWGAEDVDWAGHVHEAVERLLQRSGPPRRLTAKAITIEMGAWGAIYRNLYRLPLTLAAIRHAMERENGAAYVRRRLAWTVEKYVAEGRVPCRSTLAQYVGGAMAEELAGIVDIDGARATIRARLEEPLLAGGSATPDGVPDGSASLTPQGGRAHAGELS